MLAKKLLYSIRYLNENHIRIFKFQTFYSNLSYTRLFLIKYLENLLSVKTQLNKIHKKLNIFIWQTHFNQNNILLY